MNNYYVYKHTNLIDGRVYIGMSCQPTYKRWKETNYLNFHPRFGAAIREFGWKNFSHEVLFNNLTKEEAEKLEKEMITQYKSNQIEFGYNIASGGIGGNNKKSVKCVKTSIVYESAAEAHRQTGVAANNISACCRGKRKTAGGSAWEYAN